MIAVDECLSLCDANVLPVLYRTLHVYSAFSVSPRIKTVVRGPALRWLHCVDAGRLDSTHWYCAKVAPPNEAGLSQPNVREFVRSVTRSPVGVGRPLVVPVAPVGAGAVNPALTPRTHTVYVLPVFRLPMTWLVSSPLPLVGVSVSVTSVQVMSDGSDVCVPSRMAYSMLSSAAPDTEDHVAVSEPSAPEVAATVGVIAGICVCANAGDARDHSVSADAASTATAIANSRMGLKPIRKVMNQGRCSGNVIRYHT